MESTGRDRKIKASFDFLKSRTKSQVTFTLGEFSSGSGWTEYNARTNISKRLKQFVAKADVEDTYRVTPNILDVTYPDYLSLFKQADVLTPQYNEYQYSGVLVIELFLPLTCEPALKRALNKLSYRDAIMDKLQAMGLEKLRKAFKQQGGETHDHYLDRICDLIGEYFSGYSISQVSGRFRVATLRSRSEAAKLDGEGDEYLIDETTAVVKFIVAMQSSESPISGDEPPEAVQIEMDLGTDRELDQIEWLFRNVFISSILNTVGQEEIWVLESGARFRLNRYVAEPRDQ